MAGVSPTEGQVSVCQDGLRLGCPQQRDKCPCFSQTPRWRCWLCAFQSMNVFFPASPDFDIEAAWGSVWQCVLFKWQSRSGRPTKCFKRFHQALMWSLAGCFDASGSFVQCACQLPLLHLGMCLLEESPLVLSGWFHWGGETALRGFVNDSREYFGGRGVARCPLPHNFREYICDVAVYFGG